MKYLRISIIISFFLLGSLAVYAQIPLKFSDKLFVFNLKTYNDSISPLTLSRFIESEKINTTEAEALHKFYLDRDFQFAWLSKGNLTEHAQAFWDRYKRYLTYSKDSSFYDAKLDGAIKAMVSNELLAKSVADTTLELSLTHQFYSFIQRVYIGRIDPVNFDWNIPRKKATTVLLLEKLLSNDKVDFEWLPVSPQYLKMRAQLSILKSQQNIVEQLLTLEKNKLIRPGDSSAVIVAVKNALYLRGDLKLLDTSKLYGTEAVAAVMNFQARFGLGVDGVIGPNVVKALNIPISSLVKQLMINMERMRWIPEQSQGTTVWVNIPEYKLYVFDNNVELFKMDIVVGRAANRTVIFSNKIQYVVFSPYWNVPESIVRKEIIPSIKSDGEYLWKNNMEIIGRRNGLPIIRQKPGPENALGRVKFIFPNQYDIYFHDTPSKHLFKQSSRAFSHGCIRLNQPRVFAKFLLKDNPFWTDSEIQNAMSLDKEQWVKLAEPIPVAIGYFTAWVDSAGQLNFREDIYGHDKRMADQLFGQLNVNP